MYRRNHNPHISQPSRIQTKYILRINLHIRIKTIQYAFRARCFNRSGGSPSILPSLQACLESGYLFCKPNPRSLVNLPRFLPNLNAQVIKDIEWHAATNEHCPFERRLFSWSLPIAIQQITAYNSTALGKTKHAIIRSAGSKDVVEPGVAGADVGYGSVRGMWRKGVEGVVGRRVEELNVWARRAVVGAVEEVKGVVGGVWVEFVTERGYSSV